jgi:hypothetical protein
MSTISCHRWWSTLPHRPKPSTYYRVKVLHLWLSQGPPACFPVVRGGQSLLSCIKLGLEAGSQPGCGPVERAPGSRLASSPRGCSRTCRGRTLVLDRSPPEFVAPRLPFRMWDPVAFLSELSTQKALVAGPVWVSASPCYSYMYAGCSPGQWPLHRSAC